MARGGWLTSSIFSEAQHCHNATIEELAAISEVGEENLRQETGYRVGEVSEVTSCAPGYLGGVFGYFLFKPLPGEMIQFDPYFSNGMKPSTSYLL